MLIVSLTTIRSRMQGIERVIASLIDQSQKPDLICLNLSREPFGLDEGVLEEHIGPGLQQMAQQGILDIKFGPNIGPYRKLVPALKQYHSQDCLIVTADDDVRYPRTWLSGLVTTFQSTGNVVGYRCRSIKYTRDGGLSRYKYWSLLDKEEDADYGDISPQFHSLFTCPTGRGGVLYSPRHFPNLDLLDRLIPLAPMQDDLGFKAAIIAAGIPVSVVEHGHPGHQLSGISVGPKTERLNFYNRSGNDIGAGNLFDLLERSEGFGWEKYLNPIGHQP